MAADGWEVSRAANRRNGSKRQARRDPDQRNSVRPGLKLAQAHRRLESTDGASPRIRRRIRSPPEGGVLCARNGAHWSNSKIPADRKRIGYLLGDVSRQTFKEFGILLSVTVHRKTSGTTSPGAGFFELAEDLKLEWDDDDVLVATEMEKVWGHYAAGGHKK
jgi:hypothetical protein